MALLQDEIDEARLNFTSAAGCLHGIEVCITYLVEESGKLFSKGLDQQAHTTRQLSKELQEKQREAMSVRNKRLEELEELEKKKKAYVK